MARVRPPSSTPKPQGQAEPAGELCVLVLPVSCAMGTCGIKGWLALGAEREMMISDGDQESPCPPSS